MFKFESISEEEDLQDGDSSDNDSFYDSEENVVECSSDCAGIYKKYMNARPKTFIPMI